MAEKSGKEAMAPSPLQARLDSLAASLRSEMRRGKTTAARLQRRVAEDLNRDAPFEDLSVQCAQTLAILQRFESVQGLCLRDQGVLGEWLRGQIRFPWCDLLELYESHVHDGAITDLEWQWDDYEPLLQRLEPGRRRRRGVYYTPPAVADFVIRSLDQILQREWPDSGGLRRLTIAGDQAELWDPAVGSGVFLISALNHLSPPPVGDADDDGERLRVALGRIHGVDLLMPPLVVTHLRIAAWLEQRFVDLRRIEQIDIGFGDSLNEPARFGGLPLIVGNPPFSGISQNRSAWIESLMRDPDRGYYRVDGTSLQERKLWLNDDYVKFFRAAQHGVDALGQGVIGFVTNHAMLDNASFRGMRWSLQQTFPRQTVLDLHGNRKQGERCPDGAVDGNIFDIEQGVAICWLRRGGEKDESLPPCAYGELWGTRDSKLARLSAATLEDVSFRDLPVSAPYYLWSPSRECELFKLGDSLTDVLPIHCTAPVTARDGLVVGFTEAEVMSKIERFRDRSLSDDAIRADFFRRRRDSLQQAGRREQEYAAGDTRGWNLHDARRQVQKDPQWRERIRRCLYRPFDQRFVYWAPWMVDWPRTKVSQHLLELDNLVLITRRLQPANSLGLFLWACDGLTLDGVIRSDNRGSESILPLLLKAPSQSDQAQANLEPQWLRRLVDRIALRFVSSRWGNSKSTFGAFDVGAYLYGQMQSPFYVERFSDSLRHEFPRVFVPQDREAFLAVRDYGRQLLELHQAPPTVLDPSDSAIARAKPALSASASPVWDSGTVLYRETSFEGVSRATWDFHVGSHQVCRKWLRDRRRRDLDADERRRYKRILEAVSRTMATRAEIPGRVNDEGLWTLD